MELKIFSPTDDAQVSTIQWNYDELKAELAAKLEDYKGLVYTDSQIIEAKKDKANLNKLRDAIEAKRKEVKARCLEPYNAFEAQIKEIVTMIDEPISLIDSQIKKYDEKETEKKKAEIKQIFAETGFGDYVTIEKIWNPRWINKTYSLKQIKQNMHDLQMKIGDEVYTINTTLPDDLSVIAGQWYAKTLDLNAALAKAAEVKQLNEKAERRKAAMEARKAVEEATRAQHERLKAEAIESAEAEQKTTQEPAHEATEAKPVKRMRVVFAVTAEQPEFGYLNHLFSELREHAEFEVLSKEDI